MSSDVTFIGKMMNPSTVEFAQGKKGEKLELSTFGPHHAFSDFFFCLSLALCFAYAPRFAIIVSASLFAARTGPCILSRTDTGASASPCDEAERPPCRPHP